MKYFILLTLLSITVACTQYEAIEEHDLYDLAISGPVSAGEDKIIEKRETILVGDSERINPETSFMWTQLAGPDVVIETPFSLKTKVKNLSTGIYMFALSRTDGKETLSDTVVIVTM